MQTISILEMEAFMSLNRAGIRSNSRKLAILLNVCVTPESNTDFAAFNTFGDDAGNGCVAWHSWW